MRFTTFHCQISNRCKMFFHLLFVGISMVFIPEQNYVGAVPTIFQTSDPSPKSKIVDGSVAAPGQFPYLVSLRRMPDFCHICGGNIITPDIILTAAHCTYNSETYQPHEANELYVVAGETKLSGLNTSIDHLRFVRAYLKHPEYVRGNRPYDVALLKLENKFKSSPVINPIPLRMKPNPEPGTVCVVSGWGLTSWNGTYTDDLLYVKHPVIDQEICERTFPMSDGIFCAGFIEGGKNHCRGDSGGGLICNGVLVGIVKGSVGCAWPDKPGMYTDTGYYSKWIRKSISRLNSIA